MCVCIFHLHCISQIICKVCLSFLPTSSMVMEATNFSLPKLSCQAISITSSPSRKRRRCLAVVRASREANGRDFGSGRLVDENMIVLRMRLKEMKMKMMNEDPPSDWMEWEKKYFAHYDEDVCEAVGLLQTGLMSVRPSLAIGILALLTLTIPISTGLVLFHAIELTKSVSSLFV
ncbi:Mediator of RNA polymerase II transcription subunit [Quillaja saponaria]|uniref:Mediator of RNA polymerase II transcription subunit n=1 Tax=Quillaja saponaria TaxID=32244 RepID=A0AAD7Q6L7_QUISA|nr:Mediator of RNA polymerase II transcription subunit [Quillaja saponaria]